MARHWAASQKWRESHERKEEEWKRFPVINFTMLARTRREGKFLRVSARWSKRMGEKSSIFHFNKRIRNREITSNQPRIHPINPFVSSINPFIHPINPFLLKTFNRGILLKTRQKIETKQTTINPGNTSSC